MTERLLDLPVKNFTDGADPQGMGELSRQPYIHGLMHRLLKTELLWASVREMLNFFQAAGCGCHIVTAPHGIPKKFLQLGGKDLDEISLDTVRMFRRDPVGAGFKL